MAIQYGAVIARIRQNVMMKNAARIMNLSIVTSKRQYSEVQIAPEVGKLLGMALLAGTNIAVEGTGNCNAASIVGSVARFAPQFSKIAVVAGRVDADNAEHLFIKSCLKGKHDIAFVSEDIARDYGADMLVCPLPHVNMRKIMNFCRTRVNYVSALDKRLDTLLKSKSIEGINSIDMLIAPFEAGFVMHELRWLSRAETDNGMDIHGEDMLEMRRIGTNLSMECDPEGTKFVQKYSRIRGESVHTVWGGYVQ